MVDYLATACILFQISFLLLYISSPHISRLLSFLSLSLFRSLSLLFLTPISPFVSLFCSISSLSLSLYLSPSLPLYLALSLSLSLSCFQTTTLLLCTGHPPPIQADRSFNSVFPKLPSVLGSSGIGMYGPLHRLVSVCLSRLLSAWTNLSHTVKFTLYTLHALINLSHTVKFTLYTLQVITLIQPITFTCVRDELLTYLAVVQ